MFDFKILLSQSSAKSKAISCLVQRAPSTTDKSLRLSSDPATPVISIQVQIRGFLVNVHLRLEFDHLKIQIYLLTMEKSKRSVLKISGLEISA